MRALLCCSKERRRGGGAGFRPEGRSNVPFIRQTDENRIDRKTDGKTDRKACRKENPAEERDNYNPSRISQGKKNTCPTKMTPTASAKQPRSLRAEVGSVIERQCTELLLAVTPSPPFPPSHHRLLTIGSGSALSGSWQNMSAGRIPWSSAWMLHIWSGMLNFWDRAYLFSSVITMIAKSKQEPLRRVPQK